tara:strand:+ start:18094 stop:18279 length:186 start_codon:yes stop_codon:yes gene_type:complete
MKDELLEDLAGDLRGLGGFSMIPLSSIWGETGFACKGAKMNRVVPIIAVAALRLSARHTGI